MRQTIFRRYPAARILATAICAISIAAFLTGCGASSTSPVYYAGGVHDDRAQLYPIDVESSFVYIPSSPARYTLSHLPADVPVQQVGAVPKTPVRLAFQFQNMTQSPLDIISVEAVVLAASPIEGGLRS